MYEPVIGIEVHVQLATASKMFCGCSADYASAPPNTHVCPVCLGMPGVLPVINEKATSFSIMTGLALHCEVPEVSKWDRKNYPYPDLPKGYQISQYDLPLTRNGWLTVDVEGQEYRIGIRRAHLEEDTAKLTHSGGFSLIDFNRSGVPLLEIVTEPDIHSAEVARLYLVKLRSILRYLGVSTGNMEDGAMRCEVNISLRPVGEAGLPPTHVEVKNLNSFRAVKLALEYEIARQSEILDRGEEVEQVTMGWDDVRCVTVLQRSKEEAHDYRYFPEPDLPSLPISPDFVERLQSSLPELPDSRQERFQRDYGLSDYDAALITAELGIAEYFESMIKLAGDSLAAKTIANWLIGPLFRLMRERNLSPESDVIAPKKIVALIRMVESGQLNTNTGRDVLEEMVVSGKMPAEIVQAKGLGQISDNQELAAAAQVVISANPKAVEDYRAGKQQAIKFLVGQVMKATHGQANARIVEQLIAQLLQR